MALDADRPDAAQAPRVIELWPNCSLTPAGARLFFLSIATSSLAVAMLFVARGMWPVLPFAGLELGLLAWALRASLARRHWSETVEISATTVRITRRYKDEVEQLQFSRHWARVTLPGRRGRLPGRLLIESHGRSCEVGSFLTEDDRRALGGRLAALIGRTSESPPLDP